MGCYIAIRFPQDNPPGWYWGRPLDKKQHTGKYSFWVNFTEAGQEYDEDDDVKVSADKLTSDEYKKSWALVTSTDFTVPQTQ